MYSCTSKNIILKKDKLSQFFIKIMEWDTTERYNICKKMFQRKLIRVLFKILKDHFFNDYLDETMITQEIKYCKILNLSCFHCCIEQICLSCFWKTRGWFFLGHASLENLEILKHWNAFVSCWCLSKKLLQWNHCSGLGTPSVLRKLSELFPEYTVKVSLE